MNLVSEISMYKQLLETAEVGWWEADFENRQLICSDYLVRLLDLPIKKITFEDLYNVWVHIDYRDRIRIEFRKIVTVEIFEQVFPVKTCYGTKWVRSKLSHRTVDEQGCIRVFGTLQLLIDQYHDEDIRQAKVRVNNALNHLGNMSYILYSFIQTDDLSSSIESVLDYLLKSFGEDICGRAYLMNFDNKEQTINCDYEVCSEGVSSIRSYMQNCPMSQHSWIMKKLINRQPVSINSIDELPAEAIAEIKRFKEINIASSMLVPLICKDEIRGFIGVDLIHSTRLWDTEDYLWLSTSANLVSMIFEMLQARESLDNNRKMLSQIIESIPVGYELYDKDGFLLDLNNKDMEIIGIASKENVLGINLFNNPFLPDEVKVKIRNGQPVTFRKNHFFQDANGYAASSRSEAVDLSTKISMLYDSNNEPTNYILINIDNTEQSIAYNRIEVFEQFFQLISRFAKVGYARYDILTSEGTALDQWYLNLNEVPDTPLREVIGVYRNIHPDDRPGLMDSFEKVKRGEINSIQLDLRVLQEGTYKWIRTNLLKNATVIETGRCEMIGINIDVTELKENEKKRYEAEELDRMKSSFLANMSHEIRTPLNAIVGFSSLLCEEENENERRMYKEIILKQNELLLQLVSDILDLTQIEAGVVNFVNADIDLKDLLNDECESFCIKASEGVKLEIADNVPALVFHSDSSRLRQILGNLISNAIKYTSQGTISIGGEQKGNELLFTVTDTGEGISLESQAVIFERFYKANNFKQGTGLGLFICKSIIKQMGGEIGVVSELGKGSCFWFTVPLYLSPQE